MLIFSRVKWCLFAYTFVNCHRIGPYLIIYIMTSIFGLAHGFSKGISITHVICRNYTSLSFMFEFLYRLFSFSLFYEPGFHIPFFSPFWFYVLLSNALIYLMDLDPLEFKNLDPTKLFDSSQIVLLCIVPPHECLIHLHTKCSNLFKMVHFLRGFI